MKSSQSISRKSIGNDNFGISTKVIQITGSDSEITFIEPTDQRIEDDPKVRRPDISKAKAVLGWEPQVDLRAGLGRAIEHFRERVCPR